MATAGTRWQTEKFGFKNGPEWYRGRLRTITSDKGLLIKPFNNLPDGYDTTKQVFLHHDKISNYILPPKEGDIMEFLLGDRDKTKPIAYQARISQYSPRSYDEIVQYIKRLIMDMNSDICKKVLVEILPNIATWDFLASPVFIAQTDEFERMNYADTFLRLLNLALRHGKDLKAYLEHMIKTVIQGKLFRSTSDYSLVAIIKKCRYSANQCDKFYSDDWKHSFAAEPVRMFCRAVILQVPSVARNLLPIVTAMSEKTPNPQTNFLCDIISLTMTGENISGGDGWRKMPLIPTHRELTEDFLEKDKNLSPVNIKSGYESSDEYMNTYFRLLRAETFSAIQHGIKDLKTGKLDSRDMNVYHNVRLFGIEVKHGRFSLAIQFTSAKHVKKWEASPQLMFGNLVCISMNRKFDDVIWGTISNRDTDILNENQVIMVEVIDKKFKSMSKIMNSLQANAGSAVMVESPTYYHALDPVLQSLKRFNMENFPLQDDIIHALPSPTQELPEYLSEAQSLDASIVSRLHHLRYPGNYYSKNQMNVKDFLETLKSNSMKTPLEASQCEALTHALENKLAIIQGPPGCGKTFIGVKIVQLLLSLIPKLKKPILLLTYKNHALDEFLKDMLKFCHKDDLVRVGGRSKEPELEECNLQSILKSRSASKLFSKVLSDEIRETRQSMEYIEREIKQMSFSFNSKNYLTKSSLIDEVTDEQLRSLVLEVPWRESHSVYKVNGKNVGLSYITNVINDVSTRYGSFKECLKMITISRNHDQNAVCCFDVFTSALKAWLPDRQELWRMKELQRAFIRQDIKTDSRNHVADDSDGSSDDDSEDEDRVNQLLEARMFSDDRQEEKEKKKSGLVFFPSDQNSDQRDILIETSDYPDNLEASPAIRTTTNLWKLDKVRRWQFLYCVLKERLSRIDETIDYSLFQLQHLKSCKEELEMTKKIEILSRKKIIGMTITGASINHDILDAIGPNIVIVEEAAEILEPSLLAALTSSTEHLILIGDHKQLRPQVDTYELCRNFWFDVSMMERLIESKFPFKSLRKQNRMRPEFSELLRDIYPNLEDNHQVVSQNEALKCIEKSMFFWNHEDPEKKDRTYTNIKEAERIVALVIFLLTNGCCPSEITVLAAYLGQTKLLRKMLKKEKYNRPTLFQEYEYNDLDDESAESDESAAVKKVCSIQVQTIDMYQGDENKYVIVSLVRSNTRGAIGFLKEMNRRCVAQSRAKCGMYFVGNLNTLAQSNGTCWYKFITSIVDQGCAGYALPLQCSKHGELSRYKAINADSIYEVINNPKLLCNRQCGQLYSCDIPQHSCKKSCIPDHEHDKCPEIVLDKFPICGHTLKRKCPEKISHYDCKTEVAVQLPCGHDARKECHQRACDILCDVLVEDTFPQCGHKTERKCYTKIEDISCHYQCEEMNSCGMHQCKQKCGKIHDHNHCPELIDYKFTKCGHPSPTKKKCFEKITKDCTKLVYFTGKCDHQIEKKCYENESDVKCPVKPCLKLRISCGHPCNNACGENCEQGNCQVCQGAHKKKLNEFKKTAKKKVRQLEAKITKKDIPTFLEQEIYNTDATAAEYMKVQDQVTKFIQPCHKWFPAITKIEKVTNLVLEKKFEEAKSRAFAEYIDTKFHGTSDEGVKGITTDGFRLPDENVPEGERGMFGQGIYFATDSSKSAQAIYTKGSGKLLLCQVILGKTKVVRKADDKLNKKKLKEQKYDSVYAPRGHAVKNDEFVIFDPDQALPQYIIHFSVSNSPLPVFPKPPTPAPFAVTNVKASRTVNFDDPYEVYYSFAESHYRRMSMKDPSLSVGSEDAVISSIDIVINQVLEAKFEATKRSFRHKGIPDKEILAYHGTNPANIEDILKDNLQLKYAKRQVYGKGNYFSEFPSISLGYGQGLLLCRIIPGNEFVDSTAGKDIPEGYNSKKVRPRQDCSGASAANLSGEMIIIENSDQILPFFVIHRAQDVAR